MRYIYILLFCFCASTLLAESRMIPLKTDSRIKMVAYHPNQIYAIHTHYLISTDIMFHQDEIINANDIHLGDASAWDVQANRNHLYIKAKKLDAAGNLSVTTNKYVYHFVLNVSEKPHTETDQTFFIKFIYPVENNAERKLALNLVNVPVDICQSKQKYNLQYSFTGNSEQAPIKACDDGIFTYFKFRTTIDLPAIFMVLPDRKEEVVNYRIEQGYVVVERLAKAFTLRNGATVTSVYNDKYIGDWEKTV